MQLAEEAIARAEEVIGIDRPTDTYLMVGLGGANAGELVVGGRGVAFVCLEHFTGRVNPETYGLGLPPDLIPVWVAHELAHTVRYTSPTSASDLRRLVADSGGYYDYWATGSRATLRELLVNEGLAVHAAQAVAPGFDSADYFGYPRRQYHRLREMESFLRRAVEPDLERSGLGLRLRYLSGGMSPAARLVAGRVIPERAGYYIGYRMTEALVAERGLAEAVRAAAQDSRGRKTRREGFRPRENRGLLASLFHFPTQKLPNTRSSTSSISTAPSSSSSALVASRTWWAASTASPPRPRWGTAPARAACARRSAVRCRSRVSTGSRSARLFGRRTPAPPRPGEAAQTVTGDRRDGEALARLGRQVGLGPHHQRGARPRRSPASSSPTSRPASTQSSTRSAAAR